MGDGGLKFKSTNIKSTKSAKSHDLIVAEKTKQQKKQDFSQNLLNKIHEQRKIIIILISCITVFVVGLFAILNIIKNRPYQTSTDEEQSEIVEEEDDEDAPAESIFEIDYDTTLAEATALLDTSGTDAVIDYYKNKLDNIINDENVEYAERSYHANILTWQEYDLFISRDLKDAALKGLDQANMSIFDQTEQHMFYIKAVELAEQLGNTELKSKYDGLMAETQAAYDEYIKASEASLNEAEQVDEGEE